MKSRRAMTGTLKKTKKRLVRSQVPQYIRSRTNARVSLKSTEASWFPLLNQSQDHHWSPFMIYHHAGCEATFMCKYIIIYGYGSKNGYGSFRGWSGRMDRSGSPAFWYGSWGMDRMWYRGMDRNLTFWAAAIYKHHINTMPRQIRGSKKCLRCIVMFCRFTLDKPLHHLATATSHQICWKVSEHQTGKVQSFSALCLEKSGLQIWSTAGTWPSWTWQSIWLSIPLRWMQKGRNIYCIIINV